MAPAAPGKGKLSFKQKHALETLPGRIDEMRGKAPPTDIRVTRDDGCFAHIDGGDHVGVGRVPQAAAGRVVDMKGEDCSR